MVPSYHRTPEIPTQLILEMNIPPSSPDHSIPNTAASPRPPAFFLTTPRPVPVDLYPRLVPRSVFITQPLIHWTFSVSHDVIVLLLCTL